MSIAETPLVLPGDFTQGSRRLWTGALGAVLAAHAIAGGLLLVQFGHAPALPPPPAALPIMIDMAPLPSAPKPPPPQPQVQPVEPEPLPKAPVVEKAEVALRKPKPHKPRKKPPVEKRVEKPAPPSPKPAPANQAPDTSARPAAPTKAASESGASSLKARITYEGLLQAHLRRFQRYPQEARRRHQEGIAYVRIRITRNGELLVRTLERTSGFSKLDQEVMAMMSRAAPMPAFLVEMKENTREFVVPVIFNLK